MTHETLQLRRPPREAGRVAAVDEAGEGGGSSSSSGRWSTSTTTWWSTARPWGSCPTDSVCAWVGDLSVPPQNKSVCVLFVTSERKIIAVGSSVCLLLFCLRLSLDRCSSCAPFQDVRLKLESKISKKIVCRKKRSILPQSHFLA
jgi:hypothetical protein